MIDIAMNHERPRAYGYYLCRNKNEEQLPELVRIFEDEDGMSSVSVQVKLDSWDKPQVLKVPLSKFHRDLWSDELNIDDFWGMASPIAMVSTIERDDISYPPTAKGKIEFCVEIYVGSPRPDKPEKMMKKEVEWTSLPPIGKNVWFCKPDNDCLDLIARVEDFSFWAYGQGLIEVHAITEAKDMENYEEILSEMKAEGFVDYF